MNAIRSAELHMTTQANQFPDARRWNAVLSRDSSQDTSFVYAVRSTGIYCRPSCPSRRPHPRQVVLFGVPEAAEQAGFRPCRRCHPDQAARNPQSELVRKVCDAIKGESNSSANLSRLTATTGLS